MADFGEASRSPTTMPSWIAAFDGVAFVLGSRVHAMIDPSGSDRAEYLRRVLDEFEHRMIGYAARITGDADAARDVVQETFLRLCREGSETLNGRMPQWLFAVCRNLAIDAKRRGSRMTTMSAMNATLNPAARPSGADSVTIVEKREDGIRALTLLAALPDNQQEVIRLRLGAGLSYKEIAEVTGLSVSNVGFLMHTGLKKLRERLCEPRP